MTELEAKLIAVLRCYFQCTPYLVAELTGVVLTNARMFELAGVTDPECYSGDLGQSLCEEMRQYMNLHAAPMNDMVMYHGTCQSCGDTQIYLANNTDTPKECNACGNMTILLPPPN